MSMLNKVVKLFGYVAVFFMLAGESYLTSMWLTSSLLAVACAVWSFVAPLPALITQRFGILLLICSVPTAVILFIYLCIKLKKEKKPDNN